MTNGTSTTCFACGARIAAGEPTCSVCGRPVTGTGAGVVNPTPAFPALTFTWEHVAELLRERTAGQYEIMRVLGRGGMAAVFLAHEIALNRLVALKVMSPAIMAAEGMIERFQTEAITQARLTHSNIVAVHAVSHDPDLHYFVMQYVPGPSLDRVIASERSEGRVTRIDVVRSLLHQIGSGLSFAHRKGVIHRDIKPANVLLTADGDAVVTDFGIAKVLSNPSQTMTGSVVGTATYMSPEQCYAFELTPASDQYSLGVLAFELVSGQPPFSGTSFAVMQSHTLEPPPSISAIRPDVPPAMELAIQRMMEKKPEDRFADIEQALAAMGAASAPHSPSDPTRAELMRLANIAEHDTLGARIQVPALSPSPHTRRPTPTAQTTRASTPPTGTLPPMPEHADDGMHIEIDGLPPRVEAGDCFTLRSRILDRDGRAVAQAVPRWSSSHPSVARVAKLTGEVEALTAGSADIVAAYADLVATVRVQVHSAVAASIRPIRIPDRIEVGEMATLIAEGLDARGGAVERPVAWSVRDPAIASITHTGAARGRSVGTAVFVASVDTALAEFPVTVAPPVVARIVAGETPDVIGVGERLQLTADLRDGRDDPLPPDGVPITWRSSRPDVATVSADGWLEGLRAGRTDLEVRAGDVAASTSLTVGDIALQSLDVIGIPDALRVGTARRVSVVARDTMGIERHLPAHWMSSNPESCIVDDGGTLRAMATGDAVLTLRCGSLEQVFPVRVRAVEPWFAGLRDVLARHRARTGIVVVLAIVAFVVVFLIRQFGGSPAPPVAEITPPPPPTIAPPPPTTQLSIVPPTNTSLERGETVTLKAILDGDTAVAGTLQWVSRDSTIVRVDADGKLVARSIGATSVDVSAAGATDSLSLTVVEPTLATLDIRPRGTIALTAGAGDTTLRLIARSTHGVPMAVPRTVRWSSTAPAVASVDSTSGRIHPRTAGMAIVTAAIPNGPMKTAEISVKGAPPVVAQTEPPPPPKIQGPTLDDAKVPAAACRDAYLHFDQAAIVRLGKDGTPQELKNIDNFFGLLDDNPKVANNGDPAVAANSAGATVTFPLVVNWKPKHILARARTEPFEVRADLHQDGNKWSMTGCHIAGSHRF